MDRELLLKIIAEDDQGLLDICGECSRIECICVKCAWCEEMCHIQTDGDCCDKCEHYLSRRGG